MLQICYQHQLIPLEFVTLVLEKELQYHCLADRLQRTKFWELELEITKTPDLGTLNLATRI